MKWLVWLLVLINVSLAVYFNINLILHSDPQVKLEELAPEKIKVLTPQEIKALPKKVVPSSSPLSPALTSDTLTATPVVAANTCVEWGLFSVNRLAGAKSAVTKLALQATVKEQTSQQAKRFWIYSPPFKTTQVALAKAAELKTLGVGYLFVVQEPKWKNAISFGIFEDEQLATKLLNELRAKGVKEVVKTLRNEGKGHASLLFNNLAVDKIAALEQLKSEFPEATLKDVTCI